MWKLRVLWNLSIHTFKIKSATEQLDAWYKLWWSNEILWSERKHTIQMIIGTRSIRVIFKFAYIYHSVIFTKIVIDGQVCTTWQEERLCCDSISWFMSHGTGNCKRNNEYISCLFLKRSISSCHTYLRDILRLV